MNKIQAAYQKLGIAPGSSLDAVKKRYRQLAMVWHPDRMPTPEGRRTAEEELKQINNAFDCIKKHFESEHRLGPNCECQQTPTHTQKTGTAQKQNAGHGHSPGNGQTGNPGHSNHGGAQREKTTYEKWAEQEARAQESERRRRAEEAAHEAALREALEKARQAADTHAAAAASAKALAVTAPLTEEQLRWRVSIVLGVIFLFLLIGGFNKRYEPGVRPRSEFSLSPRAEHLQS